MNEPCEEHGEFRREINTRSLACILCKHRCSDEFLIYDCKCFGCSSNPEAVCKECSVNTELFVHLCNCFRHLTRHRFHDLKREQRFSHDKRKKSIAG